MPQYTTWAPRDQEEVRIYGGTITTPPRCRDGEEQRLRPDEAIATSAERARDVEETRLVDGIAGY